MREFKVTWTIDIEADSPFEAAKKALEKALEIQRQGQRDSIATMFEVRSEAGTWHVDLSIENVRVVKTKEVPPCPNEHLGHCGNCIC